MKDRKKWQALQRQWLSERVIKPKHWRCAKCLTKIYVAEAGWYCESCKLPCEPERVAARQKLIGDVKMMDGIMNGGMVMQYTAASMVPAPGKGTSYLDCNTCDGAQWVDNGKGEWAACPNCHPAGGGQMYALEDNGWSNEVYN